MIIHLLVACPQQSLIVFFFDSVIDEDMLCEEKWNVTPSDGVVGKNFLIYLIFPLFPKSYPNIPLPVVKLNASWQVMH